MNKGLRRIFIFAFAAIFLFSFGCISDASAGSHSIQDKFYMWWGAWSVPIAAAFGIGLSICILSWFYASFMQDDKLKAWVKSELLQLGYSALILMAVASVIGSVAYVSAELPKLGGVGGGDMGEAWGVYVYSRCSVMDVQPTRPCHIRMAEDYLEILAKSTQAQATSILRYLSFLYPLNTLGIGFKSIPAPGGALSVAPLGGLTPVIETMSMVFNLLMKNLFAIRAQQFFVDFMHIAFFPYMIAAGIFFRVFYFTRKLGGLLIALGFSFYIVLPLMYVFWMSILFSFTGPWVAIPSGIHAGEYEPAYTGTNMIVDRSTFGDVNMGPVTPVPAYASYYTPVGSEWGEKYAGAYRGETCANGIIEPWEDCGEENWAIVEGTGKSYIEKTGKPFVCTEGKICDTNSCSCTDEFYYGGTGDFREDIYEGAYATGSNGEFTLTDKARILADITLEKSPLEDEGTGAFLDMTRKAWYERLLEGFGGGFARAIPSGFLLGANGTLDNVAKLLIFSLLAPFISLMVALGTVKVLSPTFGGDVEIAGLSRLI